MKKIRNAGLIIALVTSYSFQILIEFGVNVQMLYLLSAVMIIFGSIERRIMIRTNVVFVEKIGWCALALWSVLGNYAIFFSTSISTFSGVLLFSILVMLVLSSKIDWIPLFFKINIIMTSVHAFFTIAFFVFPAWTNVVRSIIRIKPMQRLYVSGISNHYSTNAMYIVVGLLCSVSLFYYNKKSIDVKVALLSAFYLFALLLTAKRAHILFSVCAILCVHFIINIKTLRKYMKKIIVGGGFGILAIVYLSNYIPELLGIIDRFLVYDGGEITNGRIPLFIAALKMFSQKPILGWGWGSYVPVTMEEQITHNVYLQLMAETGIIGLSIFLTTIILALYKGVAMIVHNIRENNLLPNSRVFICFSVMMQLFFVFYCMTGNPLYDGVMILSIMLSYAILYAIRDNLGVCSYD